MDVYILNKIFQPIAVIDEYKSLIWTKRYFEYGDFELYIPADDSLLEFLQPDLYVKRDDDESVMIIEKLEIKTDTENGDYFIVSGRSLESILLRRIFNRQFVLSNASTVNAAAQQMVTECTTVHPPRTGTYRQIEGLTVDQNNPISSSFSAQFTGQTLFEGIQSISQPLGVGMKIELSGRQMVLKFYEGQDRDVFFSPEFDNMTNSSFIFDKSNLANNAYVAGEGEGSERKWAGVLTTTESLRPSGLDLREVYVDARDVSSNEGEISEPDYSAMLATRGREKLAEFEISKTFDAEIEPDVSFKYKTDYDLGDFVTVTNEYGVTSKPRIVEIVECWDDTGYTAIPTFDALVIIDNMIILKDCDGYVLKDNSGAILTVRS